MAQPGATPDGLGAANGTGRLGVWNLRTTLPG